MKIQFFLINFFYIIKCLKCVPVVSEEARLNGLIKEIFHVPPLGGTAYFNANSSTNPDTDPYVVDTVDKTDTNNICISGECVPFHLCVNNTIVTAGEGLISIRFGKTDKSGPQFCEDFEICCGESNNPDPASSTDFTYCGQRHTDVIESRITGEGFAQYTEFPWMIAVFQKIQNSHKFRYQCGGSLIHPAVVLTVAHHVATLNPEILKVRAGEWDTDNTNELWPHQDRDVKEIIVHSNFNRRILHNDIALLFLETPFQFGQNIDSICLPAQNYRFLHGDRCFVSGWGKDDYGKHGKFPKILKKVELPIVSRSMCQILLRKTILGRFFKLHSSFMCAGGEEGHDACNGDGGSPLVCEIPGLENRYYQAGIVAWGVGCKNSQVPGVYVNIGAFRLWIDKQFRIRNIDNRFYTVSYVLRS